LVDPKVFSCDIIGIVVDVTRKRRIRRLDSLLQYQRAATTYSFDAVNGYDKYDINAST